MKHTYRVILVAVLLGVTGCATAPRQPVVRKPAHPPPAAPRPLPPLPPTPAPVIVEAPAAPTRSFRTILAVQACLDRVNFSSGITCGELTDQSRAALRAWQSARGLPVSGEIDAPTLARCGDLSLEFVNHTVTTGEVAALTPFPTSWRGRAALKHHGYVTVLESVAEQYHASEAAIRNLNPRVPWPNPPAGTTVVVPKANPAKHVDVAKLVIHLGRRQLQGFDAEGNLVLHFPCSIARDIDKRPLGQLKVVNAASDPFYTFDPAIFTEDPEARAIGRKLVIPPGPNNPVGVAWIGLDKPGYGIHGTAWPEDIGKTESHGCFRLSNWNARKLVRMVKLGTPVLVEP